MYNNLFYQNKNEVYVLENGIMSNNLFIYCKNKQLYVCENDIRCFSVSFRRLRNTLSIKSDDDIKIIIVKYIKNVSIIKKPHNLYYLNIFYPSGYGFKYTVKFDIKLKEVDEYINIANTDNNNIVMQKLTDKIKVLIEKINQYKSKYKDDINTDDELIIMY